MQATSPAASRPLPLTRADFDFHLPADLVAQAPAVRRADARLMMLARGTSILATGDVRTRGTRCVRDEICEYRVADLPDLLDDDPLVVLNESRVVPSRIVASRRSDGRAFELLVCNPWSRGDSGVRAWVRGARRLRAGDELYLADAAGARLGYRGRDPTDGRICVFEASCAVLCDTLVRSGQIPLPPYISRPDGPTENDRARYQTVFASDPGSIAAPTAGLHFDEALLARLDTVQVTLHVGPGTFLPMGEGDVRAHKVGAEWFRLGEGAASRIQRAREQGRPILAVGTTVTRVLESVAARHGGRIVADEGYTDLVIRPGHKWCVVDQLMTNFHLPQSSLLMLTCSFGGRAEVLAAYAEAVSRRFRFYSYGDCMLIAARPGAAMAPPGGP
ncbi:MAG: tRNA preQ1(34) S-adenosylmethionine ribosyltransferase-isomerase QueA [Nannocystaceae bacterium]